MAQDIADRIERLPDESQSLYVMHQAATRAVESTRGGGWGTFRVDYITEEQARALPAYIGEYVDDRLPILFKDDAGKVRRGGSFRVDERHTRFSVVHSFDNESIGARSHFLRWDRQLWDPTATPSDYPEANTIEPTSKHRRSIGRGLLGIAYGAVLSAEAAGFTMMMKGAFDIGRLERSGATESEINKALDRVNTGTELMLGSGLVAATAMTGYLLFNSRRQNEPDQPRQ